MREDEQSKVHEPMKMSVTIADQQHQQELRQRSYELAVQRLHMRR